VEGGGIGVRGGGRRGEYELSTTSGGEKERGELFFSNKNCAVYN
jgi:hypothetical protein